MTAEVCEPLWWLTSVKTEWMWNGRYQELYNKATSIRKEDTCMKYNDEVRPLYYWDWCLLGMIGSRATEDKRWNELS